MRRLLVAAAAVAFALRCLGGCGPLMARRPTIVAYDTSRRGAVWSRAVTLLRAQGYAFEMFDETSGTIETELHDIGQRTCGFSQCRARQRVSLSIEPAGSVVCNIHRIFSHGDSREASAPETQGSVDEIEHDQAELVRAILGEAALADAGVAAAGAAPGEAPRCYTSTGVAVPVPSGGCVAAGLTDAAPLPLTEPVTLRCYTPTGVEVTIQGSTCAAAGLAPEAPAAAPSPAPAAPAGHRHHRHHRRHH